MLASTSLSTLSLVSILLTGTYATAIPGSVNTWKDWTCPPPSTLLLSFTQTQYVPVTTTETDTHTTAVTEIQTQTITLYQTIFSTQVRPTTELRTETTPTTEVVTASTTIFESITQTETTPTTELQTVVTTSPLTLTATEAVQIYSSTTRYTSLKLCPTRITNPTFTVQAPLPSDWTWGCPPGWLCKPKQIDCDFEVGLPDRNFYCAPNECIPAEALPESLQNWNPDPSGDLSPLNNPALSVNAIDSYFNMNPTDFGLGYQIFIVDRVVTFTSTSLIPPAPSPGFRRRQGQTIVPPSCYSWCNNVLLEAQSEGKTPALCRSDSAFETSLISCLTCIADHVQDSLKATNLLQIAPQFQQYMDYCGQTALIQGASATIAATTGSSTTTIVVPTTSITVVSTSSVESSPASVQASSITSQEVSALGVTTATIPTTITSVGGASTLSGADLSQITLIMPVGLNSTTTLSGTELSGATVILAGDTTSIMTSNYVTTITNEAASTGEPSPSELSSGTTTGPSPSAFSGTAAIISPQYGTSWAATLLAGLLALF